MLLCPCQLHMHVIRPRFRLVTGVVDSTFIEVTGRWTDGHGAFGFLLTPMSSRVAPSGSGDPSRKAS